MRRLHQLRPWSPFQRGSKDRTLELETLGFCEESRTDIGFYSVKTKHESPCLVIVRTKRPESD